VDAHGDRDAAREIERYGLDWVVENEPTIRRFAQTATNSPMALL
jgi:hypothetical protein